MLLPLSLVLSFVMNNPEAENALSASTDGGIVFKSSPSFTIFYDRFSIESNNYNSCFTIFLKLEILLVEQRGTFVFEWIAFSNFSYDVKDFSPKVSVLYSSECKALDSDLSFLQNVL
ncbi:hypothetical protein AVEN_267199-1 [Araneus ventricosus]|uniref:Uncharacterized protein n=1 Tax=Araneus ventricosus TaxID=182803 RepID=A0A4Y1ZUZ7_ARAVE|nr:hypothetical protein AVEN_229780-1 [Araneus ventricosus]GBL67110.1 hypothetical protein AVEN_155116-1 [Araneus ventricosus]GBL67115.1 hypothetical protein AVEN_158818-1 [Araneus ventricosus]GBL68102.1 hypothetical protein AVEN_267199-1 [Araneus ventricosus]